MRKMSSRVRNNNLLALLPRKPLYWGNNLPIDPMKNEAAQALGRLKKGVKERPSERKRASVTANLAKAREAKRLKHEENLDKKPS